MLDRIKCGSLSLRLTIIQSPFAYLCKSARGSPHSVPLLWGSLRFPKKILRDIRGSDKFTMVKIYQSAVILSCGKIFSDCRLKTYFGEVLLRLLVKGLTICSKNAASSLLLATVLVLGLRLTLKPAFFTFSEKR